MLGVQPRCGLWAFEVEGEPLLDAGEPRALGEVEEQGEVEHDRRRQDRIAAQEVDLDLHRIAEPPEDVDVVPPLLVVSPRRIVIDPYLDRKSTRLNSSHRC